MRQLVLISLLMACATLVAAQISPTRSGEPAARPAPSRAVVHVNFEDPERQARGLKNVANALDAASEGADFVVVAHSLGIGLLVKGRPELAEKVEALRKRGVRFEACQNTMRERSLTRDDLLPGVDTVPSGTLELIRRQNAGYAYFRP